MMRTHVSTQLVIKCYKKETSSLGVKVEVKINSLTTTGNKKIKFSSEKIQEEFHQGANMQSFASLLTKQTQIDLHQRAVLQVTHFN